VIFELQIVIVTVVSTIDINSHW